MTKVYVFTRAFNEEKRVHRCVNSILNQTYTDFEYLLLDNGSKDATGQIISKYAEYDKRIRPFYYSENKPGVLDYFLDLIFAESSNDAFFCTLDADDEYTPDFLEKILTFMNENNLDAAACGTSFIDTSTDKIVGTRGIQNNFILEGDAFGDHFPAYHQFMRTVWGKIFRTSLLQKCDFSIQRKFTYGADTLFTMEAFRNASRVGICSSILHKYYRSPKSVSHYFDKKRIVSDQVLHETAHDFLVSKVGKVSARNEDFLLCVYMNALVDTVKVLLGANMCSSEKLTYMINIFSHKYTKQLAAANKISFEIGRIPEIPKIRAALFLLAADWLLSLQEVPDELVVQFCVVGEFVCAACENATGWIRFKKLYITFLLDQKNFSEAELKLEELETLIPGDTEIKVMRERWQT